MANILVTGAAGFIGFHLSRRLMAEGHRVIGLDNLNDYYDVTLKQARLAELRGEPCFRFYHQDLTDRDCLERLFAEERLETVVNLAAQAGVRYSLENPHVYVQSNLVGFVNILEACRHHGVGHLIYASSSSVYGANTKMPFSVGDRVDHPISLYAATKKANELMAHTYSHLFGLPTTGLRFFTVYGPWGRPDMALFLFTKSILEGEPINVFNHGRMRRSFTYVEDVVEGIVRVMRRPPAPGPDGGADGGADGGSDGSPEAGDSPAPYRLYNTGSSETVELMDFIRLIEERTGRKALINSLPLQPGDVPETFADAEDLVRATGYRPCTPVEVGVSRFVEWYRDYYGK